MLSALIPSELSYPAMALADQLADQRFVLPDPLVQWKTSLKYQRPQQIGTNLAHAGLTYTSVITNSTDYNLLSFQDNPTYCDSLLSQLLSTYRLSHLR